MVQKETKYVCILLESVTVIDIFKQNLLSNYGFVLDPNPEDYHKVALNINRQDPLYSRKLKTLTSLASQPGLVHLLFADDTELPPKFISAARVLVGKDREIAFMSQGKEPGARCDVATLTTLWGLLNSKKAAIDYEVGDEEIENPITQNHAELARVYREGKVYTAFSKPWNSRS
jgi:hypothetical protein